MTADRVRQPGPVYDDAMKTLAEDDLPALLGGLPLPAGATGGTAHAVAGELSGPSIRTDLLARTPHGLVHGEYVKDGTSDLALRMVEYRARIRRRQAYEKLPLHQFVLVLSSRAMSVPGRYADVDGMLSTSWQVIRAADLDRDLLLSTPTTAPLAALAGGSPDDRAEVLTAAADVIATVQRSRRRRLLVAAATLASIDLPPVTIETALQEAAMPVPIRELPLAQALIHEGIERGIERGIEQGRSEGEHAAAVRMAALLLRRRFGDDPRVAAAAEALAALPEERRLDLIASASGLDELVP